MNLKHAKSLATGLGLTLRKKDGEYRVAFSRDLPNEALRTQIPDPSPERLEASAHYTDDLDDAVSTGYAMVRQVIKAHAGDDVAFFYEHNGFNYGPGETPQAGRLRCAHESATAESWARNAGVTFSWDYDPDIDSSEWSDEKPAYATWMCIARDRDGKIIGSLGGIDFGRDGSPHGEPYKRCVESDLASEAMPPDHEG